MIFAMALVGMVVGALMPWMIGALTMMVAALAFWIGPIPRVDMTAIVLGVVFGAFVLRSRRHGV